MLAPISIQKGTRIVCTHHSLSYPSSANQARSENASSWASQNSQEPIVLELPQSSHRELTTPARESSFALSEFTDTPSRRNTRAKLMHMFLPRFSLASDDLFTHLNSHR